MDRSCPVCGRTDFFPFANEKIKYNKITKMTYASRKEPEFMHLRLVRCSFCDVIYAPSVPDSSFLNLAYTDAAYDSDEEAQYAANTYSRALEPYVSIIENKQTAIDVGAGNGALLPLLKKQGFANAIGIEPSQAAIESAPQNVRAYLRKGLFSQEIIEDLHPSLICSFMTLEHMLEPYNFIKIAYEKLTDNGTLAIVVHNYRGSLNRLLGQKSPIMDIEHLQLFCPKSITILLNNVGFKEITIKSLRNEYPLRYWLRLMPLPTKIKKFINYLFYILNISNFPLAFNVSNLLVISKK